MKAQTMRSQSKSGRRRLDKFDYFVLAGGLMNVIVISYLVGYWLLH